jgi:hypothetical protein
LEWAYFFPFVLSSFSNVFYSKQDHYGNIKISTKDNKNGN